MDYKSTETFEQHIEIITEDYVEGFEPVEVYENDKMYWAYYRIKKSVYAEMKAKKKNESIQNALSKYVSGISSAKNNKPSEAISFYLQGLQAVKKYLSEETPTKYKEKDIDIGNLIYSDFNQTISDLSIISKTTNISIKCGELLKNPVCFQVTYKNKPIQGIPVNVKYSGGYLRKNNFESNTKGIIEIIPEKISSTNSYEKFTATIDLKEIAQKAVDDLFIRSLATKKEQKSAIVKIQIIAPSIYLKLINIPITNSDKDRILNIFEEKATKLGFTSGNSTIKSDYKVELKLNFESGQKAGNLTSVFLNSEIKIFDKNNNTVWVKNINQIRGVGNTNNEAKEKAFYEYLNSLNRIYFEQGLNTLSCKK